jgi:hypothetical protein
VHECDQHHESVYLRLGPSKMPIPCRDWRESFRCPMRVTFCRAASASVGTLCCSERHRTGTCWMQRRGREPAALPALWLWQIDRDGNQLWSCWCGIACGSQALHEFDAQSNKLVSASHLRLAQRQWSCGDCDAHSVRWRSVPFQRSDKQRQHFVHTVSVWHVPSCRRFNRV